MTTFTQVHRPWDLSPVHLHSRAPVWVVHYPATRDHAEHWQGYRAIARVPAGRMPWTVDNRRISSETFASLDAALAAAETNAADFAPALPA
jgi:hypothetical protein